MDRAIDRYIDIYRAIEMEPYCGPFPITFQPCDNLNTFAAQRSHPRRRGTRLGAFFRRSNGRSCAAGRKAGEFWGGKQIVIGTCTPVGCTHMIICLYIYIYMYVCIYMCVCVWFVFFVYHFLIYLLILQGKVWHIVYHFIYLYTYMHT